MKLNRIIESSFCSREEGDWKRANKTYIGNNGSFRGAGAWHSSDFVILGIFKLICSLVNVYLVRIRTDCLSNNSKFNSGILFHSVFFSLSFQVKCTFKFDDCYIFISEWRSRTVLLSILNEYNQQQNAVRVLSFWWDFGVVFVKWIKRHGKKVNKKWKWNWDGPDYYEK